jgi:hypothetical protein
MITHKFYLYRNGVELAELTNISDIEWGYARNDFLPCTFTYIAKDLATPVKGNLVGGSWIHVYRKNTNSLYTANRQSKLVYKGEIQQIKKTVDQDGRKKYEVMCKGHGDVYFSNRYITKTYTGIEEENIAWDIINTIQTDTYTGAYTLSQVNWGVTQGVLEATNNTRDRQFMDDEVLKILQQLADVLDTTGNQQMIRGFRLTPDLIESSEDVFSYHRQYGNDRSDKIRVTSPIISNMAEINNIENLGNRITSLGASNIQQTATTTDANHLNFWKLRHKLVSKTNVVTNTELLEQSEEYLSTSLVPTTIYDFSLVNNSSIIGDFRCGDVIALEYDDGFIAVNTTVRVYEIRIKVDGEGRETTTLKVAEEKPLGLVTDPIDKLVTTIKNLQERLTNTEK